MPGLGREGDCSTRYRRLNTKTSSPTVLLAHSLAINLLFAKEGRSCSSCRVAASGAGYSCIFMSSSTLPITSKDHMPSLRLQQGLHQALHSSIFTFQS